MDKDKEIAMNQTYRQFMDAGLGLNNSVSLDDIVDEKLMGFGTTIDEKIFNVTELKELLATQKEQSKDIDIRWQIKPLSHYTSADENTAFFADDLFLYANAGGELIEMYLRFSVVLSYVNNQWKVIHWHGSKPENVQSEEDTFGIENWKQKAEALEKLVEERTADLKEKNRELEIETSLERVRAIAMGMSKPDDLLSISKAQFNELKQLGFTEIRNSLIDIFHDDKNYFSDYDYSDFSGGSITNIPYNKNAIIDKSLKQLKSATDAFTEFIVEGKELEEWKAFRKQNGEYDDARLNDTDALYYYFYSIEQGNVGISTFKKISEEQLNILKRFRNVFDLAYKRYVDITNAEAQSREAQIEASLERVRSRSMAMHNTSELQEVIHTVHKELLNLNIAINGGSFITINSDIETTLRCWGSGGTADTSDEVHLPLYEKPFCTNLINGIKNGRAFFTEEFTQQEKKQFFTFLFKHEPWSKLTSKQKKETLSSPGGYTRSCCVSQHTSIFIINHFGEKFSEADNDILKRFAKVFEQTYTRFLDLQKAEAQAREAQIEAGLERVRSIAMSMMKSEDLAHICEAVYKQLSHLGFSDVRAAQIYIRDDEEEKFINYDYSDASGADMVEVKYNSHPNTRRIYDVIRTAGDEMVHNIISKKELEAWKDYLFNTLHQPSEKDLDKANELNYYLYSFGIGAFGISAYRRITDEELQILKRFRNVFSLSYQRYIDISQAEAQAREAQIELSLERVRAKTMAMHNSADVGATAAVMVEELKKLGIETIRCGIGIMHAPEDMEVWTISTDENNKTDIIIGWLDMNMHPLLHGAFESWRRKNESYSYELKDDDLLNYYNAINNYPGYPIRYDTASLPKLIHHNEFAFTEGTLFAFSLQQLTDEQRKIFKRFAGVFGQTYRRYLDLKKAEAQAREAQVEAALEKIRSRSLAMHRSDELKDVIAIMFEKLKELNVLIGTVGIWLFDKKTKDSIFWVGNELQEPRKINLPYNEQLMQEDTNYRDSWNAWLSGENYINKKYTAEQKDKYFHYVFAHNDFDAIPAAVREIILQSKQHAATLITETNSALFADSWNNEMYSDASVQILKRAAKVFEQAYVRFLDLQRAEESRREAQIETALEKVRSRTLAMQKSDELAETAAVLFQQLISLCISPNRLYINIVKDENGEAEFWITDEDGTKVSMAYADNMNNNPSFKKMFDGWKQQKKSLVIDMKGEELDDYFNYLSSIHIPFKGGLAQKRRLQYIAYFSKGFIGMASPDEQPAETLQLLEKFAYVFNLTFTRFNDLQVAEAHAVQAEHDLIEIKAARKKAEETLVELQSTQKQLVQSEKMASLGELTAGIAHEIQNPLNFVNNFSEVNKELLEELKVEADNGNIEEVKAIANDVIENSEKINHHGKRADAIVKGMLQHSRKSSGTKEPTDINALCDEYLRLSYHGLRAKDKEFNADFKTDFDESIGKINIVPQDIGRVLLNLFNNSFYAVSEKSKDLSGFQNLSGLEAYKPLVSVQTKKLNNTVEIIVTDNGNGIPQNILDKIFQPFFTTKPTGEGTGLGLSLSYDIIKAHGGEIKVETKQDEGTTFMIILNS